MSETARIVCIVAGSFICGMIAGPYIWRALFRAIDNVNDWRWRHRRLARWPQPQ